jgi:hypothetical protein
MGAAIFIFFAVLHLNSCGHNPEYSIVKNAVFLARGVHFVQKEYAR